jgi:hypothetical protein
VNTGASDVEGLAMAVRVLVKKAGVDLQVGYVDGDDVTETFFDLYKKGKSMLVVSLRAHRYLGRRKLMCLLCCGQAKSSLVLQWAKT